MVACRSMIRLSSLLPLTRALAYTSQQQRERWARRLAERSLKRNGSRVERARHHLERAFPEQAQDQIEACLAAHFTHRYRQILSLAWLRYAPVDDICDSIQSWDGVELLKTVSARGRGVIVATPHFGDWERFNLAMGTQVEAAVLYKPSSDPGADRWLYQLRSRTGVQPLAVSGQGIREVYRRLSQGGIVGILPDQVPGSGGVPSRFMGQQVMTMSLIHRLVQSTGCAVMLGRCFYVEDGLNSGAYQLKVTPAPDEIDDFNIEQSVQALDSAVERVLKEAVPQYLWTYKRWK